MKRNKYLKLVRWIPALIVMALIYYFSSRTGEASKAQSDPIAEGLLLRLGLGADYIHAMVVLVRKSGHLLEFAALSFCIAFALVPDRDLKATLTLSLVISYLWAVSDEIHQLFVPERAGRFSDTLIDLAGILLGLIFFYLLYRLILAIKKQPK